MRAPAKINLTLHILGRRADGYHELESLVAFAGIGDQLDWDDTGLKPGQLALTGPFASHCTQDSDNLVLKAQQALKAQVPDLQTGAFALVKRLPVASGMGGGSSDAAAALRLLALRNGIALDDPRLFVAAQGIGADVPVCLEARARMMRGVGERLEAPLVLPPLFAVLVNPGVGVATRAVFERLGLKPGEKATFGTTPQVNVSSFEDLIRVLRKSRNDMEDAACVLAPVITHVLNVLMAARGCRLARMSGSGATCFALFETCHQAARAARIIKRDHPEWWVKSTLLR